MSAARSQRLRRFLPLLVVLAAGCEMNLPGKPDPKQRPVLPDHEMEFTALYARNCAGCHGKDGKTGPAPPLNDDLFRASVSEEELRSVIAGGRDVSRGHKTLMPAFARVSGGTLTTPQIEVLVHEIKGNPEGKQPAWGVPAPLPKDAPPYKAPPSKAALTSADYERIRKTTFTQRCAGCHRGDGDKGDAGTLNDPAFLALISNQALRRIMITGRPDLEVNGKFMPGYSPERGRDKPLTSQEIDDLVALLASWRGR